MTTAENTNPTANALGNRFVSGGRGRKHTQPEEPVTVTEDTTTTTEEPVKKPTKKQTHKVYSFWADKTEVAKWNAYQEASAALPKREDLGLAAIREYIKKHPLQGDEQTVYKAKLRQLGLEED